MELVAFIGGIIGFIAFCAGILWIYEKISLKFGSKLVATILFLVIPFILGVVSVFLNYATLSVWEVILYPFVGPGLILTVFVLAVFPFMPEIVCIPFILIYDAVKSRKS